MKRIYYIAIMLASVSVLIAEAGYVYLSRSLPVVDGNLALPGLQSGAQIVRDRYGVPHIFGDSVADAHFALGYVHAQDRLWQMEMNRRIANGRLAEILGESALDTDKFLRTLGIRRFAEATQKNLDKETTGTLNAYVAGVNAFIKTNTRTLPPEFLLLGVRPEPWTAADTIGWVKMMAWDLGGNWRNELLRMQLTQKLSSQQIAEFIPPYPGDAPMVIPDMKKLYAGLQKEATHLAATAPQSLPEGAGSNNWVVNGTKTISGKPLLANDPHLSLSSPAIWYFAHLSAPGLNVIGATLPGVPNVVLGRNDRIAWGFTNTNPDVQDLFVEKIDAANPSNYITPTGSYPFQIINEIIKVKNKPDINLPVRISRHGPIVSDVSSPIGAAAPKGHVIAFQWTTLRDDDLSLQAGIKMNRAVNWTEFLKAARDFHSPQQNMVYADIDGNIGFIAPGRVPVRKPGNLINGLAPSPGWDAMYDWESFIPFEQLPQQFNPATGQVVTANHKITPPGYKFYITGEWFAPYRADRIGALLQAKSPHSVDTFASIQADVKSQMVFDFKPLFDSINPTETSRIAYELVKKWDGEMRSNDPAPLIFSAWYRELTRLVYADELGEELFGKAWDQRALFLHHVLKNDNGQARWCDLVASPQVETCAEMMGRSLDLAVADLGRRYGRMDNWRWGNAHFALSEHRPFSKQATLAKIFEIDVPSRGDSYSVNVGRHNINNEAQPFANRHAASLRAIYDLSDMNQSRYMHSTGQSGNRLSSHYADFAKRWVEMDYIPMTTDRAQIENGARGRLSLSPAMKN
ncbi:MAG: penicillin acylase family protein [Burkholderiales bacterium]